MVETRDFVNAFVYVSVIGGLVYVFTYYGIFRGGQF